ncbi:MAG: shikimate kinase [Sphingobacteriia bacterium]|nr:shikimate kinase [Sphingobacteriia bacterium]
MNILKINKPIVLVGLMGSGKTTIGYRLALQLGLPFFDSDKEIEKSACCSISDIFYYAGEAYFRKIEHQTMKALLEKPEGKIIATGGGSYINPDVKNLINEKGLSIWINASLDVIVERVSRRNTRPLLEHGDKRQILQSLMEERYPVYAESHITISSDNKTHAETVKMIINAINQYFGDENY